MNVEFALYEGFLIADYQDDNVKVYRNHEYYAGNTLSYEASSLANIQLMIDEASDHGDFTGLEYNVLMLKLGRTGINVSELEAPEQKVHQWGAAEPYYMISQSGFDIAAVLAVFWKKLKYTSPTELELSLQDILNEVEMTAERKQQVSSILQQMVASGLLDVYRR